MKKIAFIFFVAVLGLSACEEANIGATALSAGNGQNGATTVNSNVMNSSNRKFIQAMDICMDNFPDTFATRNTLRTSNFVDEGTFSGISYFTGFNRRIIAFASTGTNNPVCGSGRNGLRDDEAVFVTNALLAAKFGTNLLMADVSDQRGLIAAWLATTDDGHQFQILIRPQIVIAGLFKGSLVYVKEYKPDA